MPSIRKLFVEVGSIYGKWTVVSEAPSRIKSNGRVITFCLCKCVCGEQYEIGVTSLLRGRSKACKVCKLRRKKPVPFPPDVEGAKWIQLNNKGAFALVSDADYERLNKYSWALDTNGYAVSRRVSGLVCGRMHRNILTPPLGMFVDHINGNRIDNRRENLRCATKAQNGMNSKVRKGRKYKGVTYSKRLKKWTVSITASGKGHWVGVFASEVEAARAYNEAAKKMHGEFAWLNPVPEKPVKTDTSPVSPNNEVSSS